MSNEDLRKALADTKLLKAAQGEAMIMFMRASMEVSASSKPLYGSLEKPQPTSPEQAFAAKSKS